MPVPVVAAADSSGARRDHLHLHAHSLDPVELLEDLFADLFFAGTVARVIAERRVAGVEITIAAAVHHRDRPGRQTGNVTGQDRRDRLDASGTAAPGPLPSRRTRMPYGLGLLRENAAGAGD